MEHAAQLAELAGQIADRYFEVAARRGAVDQADARRLDREDRVLLPFFRP